VDERVAPHGEPARNLTHLDQALLSRVPVIAHPLPVDEPDLCAAMSRYAAELPQSFDLIHLGRGPAGHTTSLVPGDPALDVIDRDIAVVGAGNGVVAFHAAFRYSRMSRSLRVDRATRGRRGAAACSGVVGGLCLRVRWGALLH
jgi:hypothetical protein